MSLAYRWRVDQRRDTEFVRNVVDLVAELRKRDDGFVGARLYQPIVAPNSDVWELWIEIGAALFQELVGAQESVLWRLSSLASRMNLAGETTTVELLETNASLYRMWTWGPNAAQPRDDDAS